VVEVADGHPYDLDKKWGKQVHLSQKALKHCLTISDKKIGPGMGHDLLGQSLECLIWRVRGVRGVRRGRGEGGTGVV